jgi:hypothetical protein
MTTTVRTGLRANKRSPSLYSQSRCVNGEQASHFRTARDARDWYNDDRILVIGGFVYYTDPAFTKPLLEVSLTSARLNDGLGFSARLASGVPSASTASSVAYLPLLLLLRRATVKTLFLRKHGKAPRKDITFGTAERGTGYIANHYNAAVTSTVPVPTQTETPTSPDRRR